MEPRELERRLKRRELAPVVLLWGDESLLIDEAVQRIEADLIDPAEREFNRDVFYGDEAEVQAIVTAAQTMPWLAAKRLVVVRGAEALPRAADPTLVAYCKQPSPSTCLVFSAQRAEASRPLFALLLKMPWAVRFRRLQARELTAWVEQRVVSRGCQITPEAVAALVEAIGNDLRLLASEIDKLATYIGAEAVIDARCLAALTVDIRETTAFELARFLSAGDLAEALRAWHKFSGGGEYPGLALGAILHHVRQLWRVKLAQRSGRTPERLASELNIPVYTVRRLSPQAAAIDYEQLQRWLEALLEADQTLKRSGLSPQSVFERLILRFCLGCGETQTSA
jgi:DNA polymerase III subunit delta